METLVDERDWWKIRRKLPGGFVWGIQAARRWSKMGRAKGGMLVGIRKELRKSWGKNSIWKRGRGVDNREGQGG